MRVIALTAFALVAIGGVARGQQSAVPPSEERVPVVVQAPTPPLKIPPIRLWGDPPPRRFGIVTFLPPDTNGQFVRAVLPVGEMAMRARRAVVAARHRRAERDAHHAVRQALQEHLARP